MSSAVQTLQMDIAEGKKSVTQLLRQTKLIAAKLNLTDVEEWVDLELNGYPIGKERPAYREVIAEKLYIFNPYKGWLYAGNVNEVTRIHQPIAEIEILSKEEEISYTPHENFPITNSLGLTSATNWPQRAMLNPLQIKGIVEAVRNELLKWAIQLEKRGIKGEDMNFDEKEKHAAASQIFNIGTVLGTVGNVSHSPVTIYDNKTINQILFESNMPKQDKRELEDVFDELKTAPAHKKPSLIQRGEQLIVKHKDALGASAEVLGKLIHGLKGTE
jgi:hypothetical protein